MLVALSAPAVALAHPGHDHSDIPSVIRHPFAGLEHAVVTLIVTGALAFGVWMLFRRARRNHARKPQP